MPTKSRTKPAGLLQPVFVLVGAVDAGDGLQQHVVAHRLVQVHAVQDGRVEAGQQLLGDDQDLGQLVGLAERLADRLFFVVGQVEASQVFGVVVGGAVDHLRSIPAAGAGRARPCRGRRPPGPRRPGTPCSPSARRSSR